MPSARSHLRPRGISIVLVGVVLIALIGFVSLAVDIGRLRLTSAELQTAADCAARAGAFSLATRVDTPNASQDVINETSYAALQNKAMDAAGNGQRSDTGVVLDTAQDIQFGFWNPSTHVFTVISGSGSGSNDPRRAANAVRVETRRLKSRGNPLKLIFAPVLGVFSSDVEKYATAYITNGTGQNFGFIGLQSVSSNGNPAGITGGVSSDGSISLGNGDVKTSGTLGVVGDARPGMITGGTSPALNQGPNSDVDGWTANLDYKLAPLFPIINAPPPNAIAIPSGNSATLTGGVDKAHQIAYYGTIPKNLIINGYVRIYFNNATLGLKKNELSVTWQNPATPLAARLELFAYGATPKSVTGNGNAQFWGHIYAPQADVEIGGTADFTGWAIGKSLSFKGTSHFIYDGTQTLMNGKPYAIHLVQ